MPMDFPSSPTVGQQYNGYVWTGTAWDSTSAQPIAVTTVASGDNYVINGAFDIWQRGTSLSAAGGGYVVDRWRQYTDTGSGTNSRQPSFMAGIGQYCHRFTSSAASTNYSIFQYVETANAINLAGKTVTFSAYLRASASMNMKLEVSHSTTVDAGWGVGTFTITGNNTVAVTTTGARYSVTVTIPSNAVSISVGISCPTNLTNGQWVEETGVQLEEGSAATAFRRAGGTIQGELAACQRYYYRWVANSSTYAHVGNGRVDGSTSAIIEMRLPSEMRIAPTALDWSGGGSDFAISNAVSSMSLSVRSTKWAALLYPITSGLSTGAIAQLTGITNASAYIGVSAEL